MTSISQAMKDLPSTAELRERAEQGNADAQHKLGSMYKNGEGFSQDDGEAIKWYRKAAEQGHREAKNEISDWYCCGDGIYEDSEEAIEWYRNAAENGHDVAQYQLGERFYYGRGVPENYEEAVKWYQKAADQGHEDAQYELGEKYYYGWGVPKDHDKAVEWYQKAADLGHENAQYQLGEMYYYGWGVPKDHEEAVEWYQQAADNGLAKAMYRLGVMHDNGYGVPVDHEEALELYKSAAKEGNADAQSQLGYIYQNGKGVPRSDAKAAEWYRKAAEQGNANAQYNLGLVYRNGKGVPQDDTEAVKWHRKAAGQGNANAQNYLGWMYQNGKGIPQDDTEAAKWYLKASEQGNMYAQYNLGLMYRNGKGVSQDDTLAVKWYRKAAEQGYADPQFWLGWMYQNGKGVPKDDNEAVKWYLKAAEQENANAQSYLGWMYQNGKGVPQDDTEAVKWYRKAAEQENASARFNLGWMYQNGKGVPQDDIEALKWYRKAAEQGNARAQYNVGWIYQNSKDVPPDDNEAFKWFSKAAAQGDADAQKKLDQIKAAGIKLGNAEIKPLSEEKATETISDYKNKKSSAVDSHLRGITECKTILDACIPHIYMQNAFRISGISVDASTRDIKRRIDDLKAAVEMGDLQDELSHAFALDPMPSLDQIREAAQKLQEPEQRIIDEFFWFWPYEPGKSDIDTALTAFRQGDIDTAFNIWSETLLDNHSPNSTVAKHNLAVMYHLKALDAEQITLRSNLLAEQQGTLSNDWGTCLKWWEELTDDETLWSLVANRIRIIDDPRLTTGFARRMRAALPEALGKINAMLAIDFAERDKSSQAIKHINYMKNAHQGIDNVPKTLTVMTKPLKTRVTSAIEKATSAAQKQPDQAAKSVIELLQAISEPLKVIQIILPPEDHERIDLCDTLAEACLTCQIAYARETEDWTTSLEILDAASKYATSIETRARLVENRSNVVTNKYLGSLMIKIKEIEESNLSIADKVSNIKSGLLLQLSNIKALPGMPDDAYEKCADAVAHYIRGLSISEYNDNSNLIGALRILDIAISNACGQELRKQLQEDKTQLISIQKEATKNNLQMQIRSDEIVVTNEFVQYNDQKIPVSRIQGIKYGVSIQVINGIRSSSYLIDITGGQSGSIHIECKRFFRNETQAEADFNRILEALYHQVIPALVQGLTEHIVTGTPMQVGGCRLTKEGMYITTGSLLWKKETLVPFSDLRFSQYAGQITVSSLKDKGISTSMAIRDIWNAVLLEFTTKAVVEMKVKQKP